MPIQNGYHRPELPATWGMMQDGLVSPTLFNFFVENVIRTWLTTTVDDQWVDHGGMEEEFGS